MIHNIADKDKQCDCYGNELHKISEGIIQKYVFISPKVRVIEHISPNYACRECDKSGTNKSIKQAKIPNMPIKKAMATSRLLSQIITSKYHYTLPLHKQ
ncbi:MAG: IS66 family transposase zinc-finger binding domain-containing protein [Pseudoalteromonas sp.]|uniref:IS66 family transposase zinc-finger binding domain-containing protein n=1 Tax=Pseudoalteromonas sp. TaxID=53249 RepID=UPI003F967041